MFVVDFSDLKDLNALLINQYDHTFLVNEDDPLMNEWKQLYEKGAIDLRIMKNVGMEYSAELSWKWANQILYKKHKGRTCCFKVEARENRKNSALFESLPEWYSN